MFWLSLAPDVISWSSWLWQNRAEFEPVLNRLGSAGDFAQAALMNPNGALRRVGTELRIQRRHRATLKRVARLLPAANLRLRDLKNLPTWESTSSSILADPSVTKR